MSNPTVEEVLSAGLTALGYDGICGQNCCCSENDEHGLMPCYERFYDCKAGYKHPDGTIREDKP
jgi:hypothetical protein